MTVWSNDQTNQLVFPPGAVSGARIVIDQNGIIIYDASNNVVFAATPNGVLPVGSTGNPVVFGGVVAVGVALEQWENLATIHKFNISQGVDQWSAGWESTFEDIIFGNANAIGANRLSSGPSTYTFGNGPKGGYYAESQT